MAGSPCPAGIVMETITILLLTFIISVTGLFVFIWSLRKHLFDDNPAAARVIFSEGEIGQVEEPALTEDRRQAMQAAIGVQPAADPARAARSEERRVGKACVSACRSRWS